MGIGPCDFRSSKPRASSYYSQTDIHRKSGRLLCSEEDSAVASILRFYSLTRIRGELKCVALFPNQSSASSLTGRYFLFIQS